MNEFGLDDIVIYLHMLQYIYNLFFTFSEYDTIGPQQ